MQGQDTEKSANVVSLFESRERAKKEAAAANEAAEATGTGEPKESFNDVMSRNAKNKERLEKERATANKSVLRTYRIKH